MSGIVRYGSYIPYFRLARSAIGAGKGERATASYDEDSVSMGVEAAREALRGAAPPAALVFATTSPPYAEKLNAATLQAACALPESLRSLELGATSRAGLSSLWLAADMAQAGTRTLCVASDVVVGAPGGARESGGGDAAAAFVLGDETEAGARLIGRAAATQELLDVWRLPDEPFAHQWEVRFGAEIATALLVDAAERALKDAGVQPSDLKLTILDGTNPRALAAIPRALGLKPEQVADGLADSVGRCGAAHACLLLARALDAAAPGDRILVLSAADGCDAVVLEVTGRIADCRPAHTVDAWIASKRDDLAYLSYLKWRGVLPFEPPRRPDPERPAAPPSRRAEAWKFSYVGSRCRACGAGHLPPQRVCVKCAAVDQMDPEPYAEVPCRVATFTLDHLAYTLQPPVVAAILDYEGGGRTNGQLTDVDPSVVEIGMELEMTFRRLFTGQGVHNYFWKARPRR
ncbi:MAG: 3-oxoacyl-[acyl-carrier-protein] synthase III C-terminal domain-containing protein [Myxococcota bacterium]